MEELAVIIFCLVLNAFVACFEMALISVPKTDLRRLIKQGVSDAVAVLSLRDHPERTLSILQVIISIVGSVSAAVGGLGAKESLAPYFVVQFGFGENLADFFAIVCVVLPLTYAQVVLGELVPKAVALRYPLQVALIGAHWVMVGGRIFSPFVNLLTGSTKLILGIFLPPHKPKPDLASPEGVEIDNLSKQHQQYVLNLVAMEKKKIRDILVPWANVQSVKLDQSVEDITGEVYRSGHTRLPVCEGEEVIGILHTKEFLAYLSSGELNWRSIIRPPLLVNDQQDLLKTLLKMQETRSHLGIVSDSLNRKLGVVTLEDIIEEVVGDIFDEYDDGKIQKILSSKPKIRYILPNRK